MFVPYNTHLSLPIAEHPPPVSVAGRVSEAQHGAERAAVGAIITDLHPPVLVAVRPRLLHPDHARPDVQPDVSHKSSIVRVHLHVGCHTVYLQQPAAASVLGAAGDFSDR